VSALAYPSPPLANGATMLRAWREADVPALTDKFSDPLVQQFSWASVEPYTEADAQAFIQDAEQARLRGEQLQFALTDVDGAVLGGASLHGIDVDEGTAAVGYWVAASSRGRGLASGAVRLMAAWAFGELGLARVWLTCGPDNKASHRVAARCGFVREGVLRSHIPFKHGRRDSVVFGLLPGELHAADQRRGLGE
jgi:RimJ/RimL family protein N-acetyltransferase